ncbi:sigma-54-dependent Fis family transcriptional regulator [Aestuariirhabdus sp. Z084]|uniref:sigma-54-dependent Fis family transcriptional regulator n=1 Tax=Aestuariirhabdus haliotis TaxID=2918751 RepID=UPI00201B3B96|nr:sigma-54-dependent Fis family transcriptional regulator [Aestuariirhabdus haliotis]MCL6417794.1 sigma-54-dependent Fis family transcriptional regulator [Aestuariirhabdus haliotis]MCL6421719.1 sigma-54-dependent Fis family transcriptional regulator [Aestuariirhabdus haliotis]
MSQAKVPTDHIDLINSSWKRCREFGLDHSSQPKLQRLNKGELSSLIDEHQFLVQTTGNEVLPYYENILSNSKSLILLTDSRGQLINSWGDRRFVGPQRTAFFEQGVAWNEKIGGTNAIGTALATGEAVQIQRDEHFLKANRFMIGSAAPIYNANRDLLGVLDVSSDSYLPQAHTLGMVKLMSQSVENRLIINRFHQEHFLLTFNTNLDNIDSPWAGLLVFNDEGTVISANRRAELMLGQDLTQANIIELFDCPLRELKSHPEQLPVPLKALGKYQMHALIKRPSQPVIEPVDFRHTTPVENDKDCIPLHRLGFGDEQITRAIHQAERIIEKEIPILIHGETGVGKEVFVKALHQQSSRRSYPLVAVNCAAIPGELVESELFGYAKGAFTGASSKGGIGLIRKAHKGTLFLDEIGDMPKKAQARLLRVLQERKVTPLGTTESYAVDIKLISATNRSLKEAVDRDHFRQDLYYRVSGLNLELPPLRQRTDREALFQEIHRLYRTQDQADHLSQDILTLFNQHPWPGNIRQLVSVLQIALAMADREPIRSWDLPDDFFEDIQPAGTPTPESEQSIPSTKLSGTASVLVHPATATNDTPPLEAQPAARHNAELLRLYNQNMGNISRTARALNMSRNTLYKRLRELGVR